MSAQKYGKMSGIDDVHGVALPCPRSCSLAYFQPRSSPSVATSDLLARARNEKSHIGLGIERGARPSLECNRTGLAVVEGLHPSLAVTAFRSAGSDRGTGQ